MDLSNLPSDIIRNLVRLGLESVDEMKLISPRWRILANEHLINRKHLPSINCLHFDIDVLNKTVVNMQIPMKYRHYFGVSNSYFKGVHCCWDSECIVKVDSALFERTTLSRFLAHVSARCSSIERIKLDRISAYRQYCSETIAAVMNVPQLKEFEYVIRFFNEHHKTLILDFIKAMKISRLILTDKANIVLHDRHIRSYLNETLRHVSSVGITIVDDDHEEWTKQEKFNFWCKEAQEYIDNDQLKSNVDIEYLDNNPNVALVTITVASIVMEK